MLHTNAEGHQAGNPTLDNCPNNGGKRIFPGKVSPEDQSPGDRKKVKLVATVDPPIPGVTVHFKVWDVDDPFDQLNPGMPNVGIIDGDAAGPDNRPSGESPWTDSADTDEDGKATVTFTVSMQPGNNYRAGASVLQDAIEQSHQTTADALGHGFAGGYSVPVVWSPMLTVWRKLWIERDTMCAPVYTQISVTGTAGAITANTPVGGQSTVDLGLNLSDEFSDLNLYEEGEIRFLSCPIGSDTFPIVESTSEGNPFANDSVVVLGLPGACANGSIYILRDDDDPSVFGNAANPRFPNGGQLLIDAYGDAYILAQYAGEAYRDVVEFSMHLTENDVRFGLGPWNDNRNLSSSAEFWSCFVVGCWEAGQDWDADPDLCFTLTPPFVQRAGAEGAQTGVTRNEYGETVIYLQALADDTACMQYTDEQHTVTHEIGHTCGSHNDHVPGSIMEEGAPQGEDKFAPQSIVIFRSEVIW